MTAASSGSGSTLPRNAALAVAVVLLALAATVFLPPRTRGPYARDFEAYYAAGAVWDAGGNPWSREVWPVERTIAGVDPSQEELLPYVGPAAALPLFGALARLPHPVAVRVWMGLVALATGGLVLAALALAHERRVGALLAAFALTLVAGPTISDLALGQVALVAAAGIACALVAYARGAIVCGALATLLAGLQPNLALALIARMRDRVALISAALGALGFALLTLIAGGGVAGFVSYLQRLSVHGRAERFVVIQHTPAAIAWALGAQASTALACGTVVAVATVLAVVITIVRAKLNATDGTLLALAVLPLAVPFFHEHDFVIALIPALVLASRATGAARAASGIAVIAVLADWLNLGQRPAAHAQAYADACALCFAFIALGRGRVATRADLAPFITAAALFAVSIPLVSHHTIPTWPDALPPAYRAPANADASAAWGDEQHVAGLEARDPISGALRAIPLGGSILLGLAIVLDVRGRRRVHPAAPRRAEPETRCAATSAPAI